MFNKFVGNKAKERISKGMFQENKAHQRFGVLCFLETPVLRLALLPYYQWVTNFRDEYLRNKGV